MADHELIIEFPPADAACAGDCLGDQAGCQALHALVKLVDLNRGAAG